jgi:NaMN:DMB phosphoribosyltransferase
VGAGPLPRVAHPPRPPIPIGAVDDEAMAAARERGESEAAAWLAGVAGAALPLTVRRIDAAAALGGRAARADPGLSVPEVAAAVDAGRDTAAAAAAEGIALLIASGAGAAEPLIAALADAAGHPLRALRRLGSEEIAVLCGVALGAGERGLGCACEGIAALAGAAVAAGIEPSLRPRLRALDEHEQAARLGIGALDAGELAAALH